MVVIHAYTCTRSNIHTRCCALYSANMAMRAAKIQTGLQPAITQCHLSALYNHAGDVRLYFKFLDVMVIIERLKFKQTTRRLKYGYAVAEPGK